MATPLFSVCAATTIYIPLTVLGSCLPMDYLFQITFDGLFVSDNIYFIKLIKIISFRYMHEYLFFNEIFVSDTDEFHSVQRAPFVLRALFGVRVPFTINVPLTILDSCSAIDYLFQIPFDGLFVSDNF